MAESNKAHQHRYGSYGAGSGFAAGCELIDSCYVTVKALGGGCDALECEGSVWPHVDKGGWKQDVVEIAGMALYAKEYCESAAREPV